MDNRNLLQKYSDSTKYMCAVVISTVLLVAKTYFDVDVSAETVTWVVTLLFAVAMGFKGFEDFAEKLGVAMKDVSGVLDKAKKK